MNIDSFFSTGAIAESKPKIKVKDDSKEEKEDKIDKKEKDDSTDKSEKSEDEKEKFVD